MRALLCCLLLSVAAGAQADALADANRLLAEKSYPQARRAFEQLASAGSAEARLRLGEMYWYGDGVAVDRTAADALFAQAAAGGSREAAAAMTLSSRRAARSADIAYWLEQYDGADLAAGHRACGKPSLPELSRTRKEVRDAAAQYDAWAECEKRFFDSLAGARAGSAIPGELVELMSNEEARQASERLGRAYEAVARAAGEDAKAVISHYTAWQMATKGYLVRQREEIALMEEQRRREINADLRRAYDAIEDNLSYHPPKAAGGKR
jgi:TPR repeat protein